MRCAVAGLLIFLAACTHKSPAAGGEPLAAADCAADADCAIAEFPDPAEGGCCANLCDRPAVTAREAERRRLAWEAACSAVRCAGDCTPPEDVTAVCRAGSCVTP